MDNKKFNTFFDCNSNVPLLSEAKEAMYKVMDMSGNASSTHIYGRNLRKIVEDTRETIGEVLKVQKKDNIIFNSGGTEGNNTVLKTFTHNNANIFISAIEHKSIIQVSEHANIIPVNSNGIIDLVWLEDKLSQVNNKQPTLVSVMLANNETGIIQPLQDLIKICKKYNAYVHSDIVAAWGKIPFDLQLYPIDYLTISSHKIGGPAGCGVLFIKENAPYNILIDGGKQEKGKRSGSLNVIGIAGFGAAAQQLNVHKWQRCAKHITQIEDAVSHNDDNNQDIKIAILPKTIMRIANTIILRMPNVNNMTQLINFDMYNIAVSAGSACSSGVFVKSHVLKAMGVDEKIISECIRISISPEHDINDIAYFINIWHKIYKCASI